MNHQNKYSFSETIYGIEHESLLIFNLKKIRNIFLLLILSLSLFSTDAFSQKNKDKLQENKKKIESEIIYTNKLLEETKKNKETSLNQLLLLKNQIEKRQTLINNYSDEINNIHEQINNNQSTVEQLVQKVFYLKKEYSDMIYYAYKSRSMYSRLMFILSSENFNQAYRRIKYFQQYSSYRKKQVQMIQQTQQIINNKLSTLNNQKTEKVVLLTQKEKEKKKLSIEKEEKDNTISKLKKKEKNLSAMLKKKQREAEKLQKEIEKIITEEIRKSKIPEIKENKTVIDKKPNTISLTPDESIISNNFEINKGRLPWPTEKGVISSSFGEHPHPVHKDVKVKNNGIDILTNKGSYARSIFNGVVTAVIATPNGKKAVIIRHGEYLSVYSNLDDVIVSKGAKVSSKQKIGSIALNSEESSTELHFEIWKNTNFQNPQPWLAGN